MLSGQHGTSTIKKPCQAHLLLAQLRGGGGLITAVRMSQPGHSGIQLGSWAAKKTSALAGRQQGSRAAGQPSSRAAGLLCS